MVSLRPEDIDICDFRQKEYSCLLASYALGTVALLNHEKSFKQVFVDYLYAFCGADYSHLSIRELAGQFVESVKRACIPNEYEKFPAKFMVEIHKKLNYDFSLKIYQKEELSSAGIIKLLKNTDTLTIAILVLLFTGFNGKADAHYMLFGYNYDEEKLGGIDTSGLDFLKKGKYPRFEESDFRNFLTGNESFNEQPLTVGERIILFK